MLVGPSAQPSFTSANNPSALVATSPTQIDTYTNACRQYLRDHDHHPEGPSMFVYGMSLLLGQKTTRRLSNLISCTGLPQFYPARREYPILGPSDEMAARFQPKLSTMSEAIIKPRQIRYEILPKAEDKNYCSIIYYVGMETENLPIPVIGKLYDLARPVLFGAKHDWEAIQVDIDEKTQEPIGLSFETSNYSNSPESFDLVGSKDMHLFTRVEKKPDGTWEYTVQQKNGKIQKSTVSNPFKDGDQVNLSFVCWNGSFDLCDRVSQNSELKLYPFESPKPEFLDIDTYRQEGIDLRMDWLMKRKIGKFNLPMPQRELAHLPAVAT